MSIPSDPNALEWQFSEIPAIEDVPADACIMVWDVPSSTIGLMHPWGNDLNPTRWDHNSCHGCLDGCWTESRGQPRANPDGSYTIRENGVNLVQYRSIRKPVWWAWVRQGTPGNKHRYPTWREARGPLAERDWE